MKRQHFLQQISDLLARFVAEVRISNSMNLFDKNRIAEDVLIPIFSEVYDLENLENLNERGGNFEGIDLGDQKARIAFQITSNTNNKKIKKTLQSIVDEKYYEDYDKFIVYDLTKKQDSYSGSGWCEIIGGAFTADDSKITGGKFEFGKGDIWDETDLSAKICNLPLEKLQKIAAVLESEFGGYSSFLTLEKLMEACEKITAASVKQVLDGRHAIRRKSFSDELQRFLNSSVRYGFTVGATGAGKSTALAIEAENVRDKGWRTLLFPMLPENSFSLEYVKEEIRKSFATPLEQLEWRQIVATLEKPRGVDEEDAEQKGLIIILDGLEVADPAHFAAELSQLHQSLVPTSPERVKVILSCRDTEFENFLRQRFLPDFNQTIDFENNSLLDYVTFEIKDFTNSELDAALIEIGATDLLSEWDVQGSFNSHRASLRSLLKHPGTFEHYADLFARRRLTAVEAETWSSLIEKRFDYCLREAEREIGIDKKTIKNDLIDFAKQCREQSARDFALNLSEVQTKFPQWFAENKASRPTTYSALLKSGVLEERSGVQEQKLAAFKITDAGAYLLSFALEKEFNEAATASSAGNGKTQSEIVSAWLGEGWSYSPVTDAVLALIDRLSDSQSEKQKQLLPLLEALIANHHHNSLFELMKPAVLALVFKLIKKETDGDHRHYDYFEAARHVRYSSENKELLRRNFTDLNAAARELAVELTGIYKLADFVPQLIELLEDEEEERVRSAFFKACGSIGVSAIEPLLEALDNPETGDELAKKVVWALINIGHLNERISVSLSAQFKQALTASNAELIKTLLLVAAHFRDRAQIDYVLQCLTFEDDEIIWRAAKFFTEVPNEKAFEPLRKILGEMDCPQGAQERWHFEQVIAALVKINRNKIAPELQKLFEKELKNYEANPDDNYSFRPSRIAGLTEKHDLPYCYPMLFEHLAKNLKTSPASAGCFFLTEDIGKTWNPATLEKLIDERLRIEDNGADVAHLFVEAILPHIQENDTDDYGDRLNQASHLLPAIKSQAKNFVPEAGRLLMKAPYFSTKELSLYFWIIGDERAEDYLLYKFDETIAANKTANEQHKKYLMSDICRALGVCGTSRTAQRILSFLAEDAEGITINFPVQTLLPLLIRKVVEPSALAELAANENNNWVGRAISVEALTRYDAAGYTDLFCKLVLERKNNPAPLVRDAVIALGATGSLLAIKPLREVLRDETVNGETKGYAARALSLALDAKIALPDIEEAFLELKTYDQISVKLFVNALTHFGEQTSIKALKQLENAPPDVSRYIAEALSAIAKGEENDKETIEKLEKSIGERVAFFDRQSYVVRGMLRNPQNHLLTILSEHLEKDRLNQNSRWQISNFLPRLASNSLLDRNLVLRIAARIVCDWEPSLRYNILSVLSFLDKEFCREIYNLLITDATANEWTRACAVESLGYWDSDESELQNQRYDKDLLVRRGADLGLAQKAKREKLNYHLEKFQNEKNGLARLSTFICLLENGDLETVRWLAQDSGEESLQAIYASHLKTKISERLDRAQSNLRSEQEKRLRERGTISFD